MKNINTIIWDWKGTLLKDIDICMDSINSLLQKRNHNPISKDIYKEIFTLPVKDYYIKAVFDFNKESFNKVAIEFIELYHEKLKDSDIFKEVISVLEYFYKNNYQQLLVSAMEHSSLVHSVKQKGIYKYFNYVSGINDHYAVSKIDNASKLLKKSGINSYQACLIGDTIHDYEVAQEIGCKCLLVSNGHQSIKRLKTLDCDVIEKLSYVTKIINE